MVAPELRGQGLASRALEALIAWGTHEFGLQRVNIACHIDNTASQRVAEKCGFVFVCREGDEYRFRLDTMVKAESRTRQWLGWRKKQRSLSVFKPDARGPARRRIAASQLH